MKRRVLARPNASFLIIALLNCHPCCRNAISANLDIGDAERVVSSTATRASYTEEKPWEEDLFGWTRTEKLRFGILTDGGNLKKKGIVMVTAQMIAKNLDGVHRHRSTPKTFLEKICMENPDHEWEVSHGAINILPKNMEKAYLKPLKNNVPKFAVKSNRFFDALEALFNQENLPLKSSAVEMGEMPPDQPQEYRCNNVTVLECINIMAEQSNTSWQLMYLHKGRNFYVGDRTMRGVSYNPTWK